MLFKSGAISAELILVVFPELVGISINLQKKSLKILLKIKNNQKNDRNIYNIKKLLYLFTSITNSCL